jgi:acetoin utilization deacetylase AcuC-like enzyme
MKVGVVKDSIYLEHITDEYHPENPQRLQYIYEMLEQLPQEDLVYVAPRPASNDEICLIHDVRYHATVAQTAGKSYTQLDPDTSTSPRSYEAACMAVGGLLSLADALMKGEIDNGIALVRPPGHHAEQDRAMGFCLFNNIAIAARYLVGQYGLDRILLVDFDLHHGNGTQHSLYDDPKILYFSTHQYPYYPGSGWYTEVGQGEGKGYTVNVPLTYGMDDVDYDHIFKQLLVPISDAFHPQIVLVSAGFDIHRDDPLGGMAVTEAGFANMTRILLDIASRHCGGKMLVALEGGYDLNGLTRSVQAMIMEMKGAPISASIQGGEPSKGVVQTVASVKEALKPYWKTL